MTRPKRIPLRRGEEVDLPGKEVVSPQTQRVPLLPGEEVYLPGEKIGPINPVQPGEKPVGVYNVNRDSFHGSGWQEDVEPGVHRLSKGEPWEEHVFEKTDPQPVRVPLAEGPETQYKNPTGALFGQDSVQETLPGIDSSAAHAGQNATLPGSSILRTAGEIVGGMIASTGTVE